MRNISEIEELLVQWSSIPIAIVLFGSVAPNVMMPVEAAISRGYEKLKTAREEIKDYLKGSIIDY